MKKIFLFLLIAASLVACQEVPEQDEEQGKAVVYQVFTRLFGNTNTTNNPWGTIEENGVGKFNDFTDKALAEIKDLGVTHVWYTGVPHHGVIRDYTAYGVENDDPDVVKGRAGSPYAVKDYYNVNPDLAVDPAKRLEEFEALIARTHAADMKVIIDIVPNHVARNYHSITNPEGVRDFGEDDDVTKEYDRDNNFYYILGQDFEVPNDANVTTPLGGEKHDLSDGVFVETPAKWTGNGSRAAKPNAYDWYETVKVNYGVRPDGTEDFPQLPDNYDEANHELHYEFWQGKEVPSSWLKFRDIALYWLEKGVDGFRYDMAEMVPVEFWSYMNSYIKHTNPDAFLMAEVYNPKQYRAYIHEGKMDYLYDKVGLYDSLKVIMQGRGNTDHLVEVQSEVLDIEHNMLHFLENHDEQRIASPEFAGDALLAMPAMVVSATISTSPTMIYFGQEVGEKAALNSGFGTASRTSIFDYCGVPAHQRWVNNGAHDGGQLSDAEKDLRHFYKTLLRFTARSSAMNGEYAEIHTFNRSLNADYTTRMFSFLRWDEQEAYLIFSNFGTEGIEGLKLTIPQDMASKVKASKGVIVDQLNADISFELESTKDGLQVVLDVEPLQSFILKLR